MGAHRVTELDGVVVVWRVEVGVVRVLGVRRADGASTTFRVPPTLAECIDLIPRELWVQVRYQYEQSRNEW
ncbi:hypothetical protein IU486_11770 [Streptomyces gardneri]|uniref:hypothetical protein n=1 Tax=Nocardia TaxID=1817 RepID=UPI00135C4B13|nr:MULTISPECIES: hypothetical protein [Nocardia]MBF6165448.1 hypothetical protein [Streptomyces gardneri]MBF6206004.1 hypothetical protein [Streptomyces gardneri]UAK34515.1 hypothetical protein K8O92_12115 [Nocardia asteroides]